MRSLLERNPGSRDLNRFIMMSMLMMLAFKSGKCVSTRAAPLSLLFFSPSGEVILLSVRW